jgi:hypothetical protein
MMPGNHQTPMFDKVLIPTDLCDLKDKGRNLHMSPLLRKRVFDFLF